MKRTWLSMQRWTIDCLDALASLAGTAPRIAPHLSLGLRGEREALFELRRRGYVVVGRRWSSSRTRGDLDLIAWEGDWLCFVEVKTRSRRSEMAPAETAVDHGKQKVLQRTARAYLRSFPEERRRDIPVRFDILAVYLDRHDKSFDLFRGAFGWQ